MDKQIDFEAIVGQIARAHGTTPQEVRLSMQQALDEGRGNPDPARAYECKFDLGPLGLPVHAPQTVPPNEYGYDPVALGDTDCRMMLQYARMRAMAGEDAACAVEAGVRARVLGYLRDDGLLFGYFEAEESFAASLAGMAKEEVNTRWQEMMAPFFDNMAGAHADQSMVELEEVFHLD